jgi:hypothetical protein
VYPYSHSLRPSASPQHRLYSESISLIIGVPSCEIWFERGFIIGEVEGLSVIVRTVGRQRKIYGKLFILVAS